MALDKQKESPELSGFNINKLSTDAGLVEFAKIATNASPRDMKKWGDAALKTKPAGATNGDVLYKDYLHRRLGMGNKNEIDSTTMVALKKIAESGAVTRIPYTTQTKGKETSTVKKAREATLGTQSIESIVSIKEEGVTPDNAKKILELLPSSNGLPTTKAIEMWDRILLSEKKAIQVNIGTKDDGILGKKTILALQKRANNEIYAGDAWEFPRNKDADKKLTTLATVVAAKKPAEGAAKPAEGAAKPAEGAAKPAEAQTIEQQYELKLQEIVDKFDSTKYTYISYEYEFQGENGKKTKKTEVVQVNNKAFEAAGINPSQENAYKILHIIQVGALTMSDWFKNVDTIEAKLIPPQSSGNDRIDYINTLLTQAKKPRIELQTFKDANKYLGSLSRTASLGFWTASQERIKKDERKDDQQDLEKKFEKASQRIIDTNNSDNLARYYTSLIADAKDMHELESMSRYDTLLRSIIEDPDLGLKKEGNTRGKFGAFAEGTQLKALQRDISGGGRRKEFEGIIKQNIESKRNDGFIFRNGTLMIDENSIKEAVSGDGILKGNSTNKKGEKTDIYLSVHALPSDINIPGFDTSKREALRGKTVSVDIEGAKDVQIYIGNNDTIYIVNSPKNIGVISQMFTNTGDIIKNETTQKVLIAVGASLMTLAATDNLSWNIGTPNIPRISGHGISIDSPDISGNLNNAATGYVATALVLNAALTETQAKLRSEKQYNEAMKALGVIAKSNSQDALERFKKYYLEQAGM